MLLLFLVICLAAVSWARPEAPLPAVGVQFANQQTLPLNAPTASPPVYQQLPQQQSFVNFAASPQLYAAPAASAATPTVPDSYNVAYHHSAIQHASGGYPYFPAETQVLKHIYVHVPPKDFEGEDIVRPHVHLQAGPRQKHYKIVFIKAPTAPSISAPIVGPAPTSEEKTIIYVLHKKPEESPDIVIPTPTPTKPSKPEVYFIKYKTKKEEAPVYGPPGGLNIEPRHGAETLSEYDASVGTKNVVGLIPPISTAQSVTEATTFPQQQVQQVIGDNTAVSPSADFPVVAQAGIPEANNQYVPPETTSAPIIVGEPKNNLVPTSNFAPSNRYHIKKKK